MGVIQRQGIKHAMVSYVGVLLGAVNILLLYPWAFSSEQLGIYQYVSKTAQMLGPLATFGASALAIRFFPVFAEKNKGHNGLLALLLLIAFGGLSLFYFLVWLSQPLVYWYYSEKSPLFIQYLPFVLPLTALVGLSLLFTGYISNFNRIVVPGIFNNPFQKITAGSLAALMLTGFISFTQVIEGVMLGYGLIIMGLIAYLYHLGQLHLRFYWPQKHIARDIAVFASFGLLGGLGSVFSSQIDIIMVGNMIDLSNVATFAIAFFMADVLDVPRKAIESISAPIVSKAWREKNYDHILDIYRKSALNQFLLGLLLLLGIWCSIDDLFAIMPNGERYADGKYVVLILGIGKLVDLVTGANHIIIGYSPYFRFNFYAVLALGVFNILFNLLLIPPFQIHGAALATMSSLIIYNLFKLVLIYWKEKLHPLTYRIGWVLLAGGVTFLVAKVLPSLNAPVWDIILRSVVISAVYLSIVIGADLSPDITRMYHQALAMARKAVKRSPPQS
jgi:O-antigen/teichoic acid export membrane protein